MKRIITLFLFVIFTGLTYGQRLHLIRIVHIGDEDKPVGTLAISVEKLVKPEDRGDIDQIFGKSVKTDIRTFKFIEAFTKNSQYLVAKTNKRLNYLIVINSEQPVYLSDDKSRIFFDNLKDILLKNKYDKNVVKALDNEWL